MRADVVRARDGRGGRSDVAETREFGVGLALSDVAERRRMQHEVGRRVADGRLEPGGLVEIGPYPVGALPTGLRAPVGQREPGLAGPRGLEGAAEHSRAARH